MSFMMECVNIISLGYVNKLRLDNSVTLSSHLANFVYLGILNATINKMQYNVTFIKVNYDIILRYKL